MDIKGKEIAVFLFFQLLFLQLIAQDCNHKSSNFVPKESTLGTFNSTKRNIGHPYTMFNKIDYPMSNSAEIEKYLDDIRGQIIQSTPKSGIGICRVGLSLTLNPVITG